MTGATILKEKLRLFSYYFKKLPLYLQNSYGFTEHFRIWYDLLVGSTIVVSENTYASDTLFVSDGSSVTGTIDTLFELLNIFDKNCLLEHTEEYAANEHYLEFLNSLPDTDEGTVADILDKIGALFDVKRMFSVVVSGTEYELNLNNRDFLMLIKCTIIKNYFDGTYEELSGYYRSVGLPIFITTVGNASCSLYLLNAAATIYSPSEDVQKMFLAGLLTVKSMGISYTYSIHEQLGFAIFDSTETENMFDEGVFTI